MATTLLMVDNKGLANVFYLNMHNDKSKSHSTKLTKIFNLEIAIQDEPMTPTPSLSPSPTTETETETDS